MQLSDLLQRGEFEGLVISNTFALPGCKPERVEHFDDVYRSPIYRYVWHKGVSS